MVRASGRELRGFPNSELSGIRILLLPNYQIMLGLKCARIAFTTVITLLWPFLILHSELGVLPVLNVHFPDLVNTAVLGKNVLKTEHDLNKALKNNDD